MILLKAIHAYESAELGYICTLLDICLGGSRDGEKGVITESGGQTSYNWVYILMNEHTILQFCLTTELF